MIALLLHVGAVLMVAVALAAGAAAETVSFPGENVTIEAQLFRPSGAGPFPAVVALHGCAGLYGKKNGNLSPRHADWAERLQAQGFMVLFPDSFGSRGEGSQCRETKRIARASSERVDDVLAAKAYLQSRSDVKAEALSLLGWSNGASTVLYTLDEIVEWQDGEPPFVKAVAFYPGCRSLLKKDHWRTSIPLLILIGEADDWTPMQPCKDLVEKARETGGAPVSIITYPDAYHGFDHPSRSVRRHKRLAYTESGSGEAHTGTNFPARKDAIRRVPEFLTH